MSSVVWDATLAPPCFDPWMDDPLCIELLSWLKNPCEEWLSPLKNPCDELVNVAALLRLLLKLAKVLNFLEETFA